MMPKTGRPKEYQDGHRTSVVLEATNKDFLKKEARKKGESLSKTLNRLLSRLRRAAKARTTD